MSHRHFLKQTFPHKRVLHQCWSAGSQIRLLWSVLCRRCRHIRPVCFLSEVQRHRPVCMLWCRTRLCGNVHRFFLQSSSSTAPRVSATAVPPLHNLLKYLPSFYPHNSHHAPLIQRIPDHLKNNRELRLLPAE